MRPIHSQASAHIQGLKIKAASDIPRILALELEESIPGDIYVDEKARPLTGGEFFAAYLPELTAGLSGSLLAILPGKFQKPDPEQALERSCAAAVAAVVAAAETDDPDEQKLLADIFGQFFSAQQLGPKVAAELAELRRGESLDRESCGEIFEEAGYEAATLPSLDLDEAFGAFEAAFLVAAIQESAFQGEIQAYQSIQQTEIQREILERMETLVKLLSGSLSNPKEGAALARVEASNIDAQNVVSGIQVIINNLLTQEPGASPAGAEDGSRIEKAYLRKVWETAGRLQLSGVDPSLEGSEHKASRLRLANFYIPLRALGALNQEQESSLKETREHRQKPASAIEQLDKHNRLVLLGAPGGGKSTLVDFITICMAGEYLGEKEGNLQELTSPIPSEENNSEGEEPERQSWSRGPLLPLRIILRDFASRGLASEGERGCAEDLLNFIEVMLREQGMSELFAPLKQKLRDSEVLVLFDGLDEVPEPNQQRVRLVETIEDFASSFSSCRILVTSRPYAYQETQWQLEGFATATLAEFDRPQIAAFVERWYEQVAPRKGMTRQEAKGRSKRLRNTIFGNEKLLELAQRPLLLTLMASHHSWRGGDLPERRQELYESVVSLLLQVWEQQRHLPATRDSKEVVQPGLLQLLKVRPEKVRRLLENLAFKAHESQPELRGTADIPEADLHSGLLKLASNSEVDARPQLLLPYLQDRAGLLLPRGDDKKTYGFPHRSIQEYLAACEWTQREGFAAELAERARTEPDRWREVALLAAAKAKSGAASAFWDLIRELCHKKPPKQKLREADAWGAQIAAAAILESADLDCLTEAQESQLDLIQRWLLSNVKKCLPPRERIEAGRLLSKFGDTDPRIMTLEKMEFCWVPAGPFFFGPAEASGDTKEGKEVDLPHEYWMGRFPITHAQFAFFVREGGYQEKEWWPEAKEQGYWKDGKITLEWAKESRDGPARFGSPYDFDNQPVVGVTWFEALAFSRWLTREARLNKWIPADWSFCLPSEAEWEKSCRGGPMIPKKPLVRPLSDGLSKSKNTLQENQEPKRELPNRNRGDSLQGNYGGSSDGPSRPGCFPQGKSPSGCEDLLGNVWEWTRSPYRKSESVPTTASEEITQEIADSRRGVSLRGLAYYSDKELARCSARCGDFPGVHVRYFGFRLVLLPFSLDSVPSEL